MSFLLLFLILLPSHWVHKVTIFARECACVHVCEMPRPSLSCVCVIASPPSFQRRKKRGRPYFWPHTCTYIHTYTHTIACLLSIACLQLFSLLHHSPLSFTGGTKESCSLPSLIPSLPPFLRPPSLFIALICMAHFLGHSTINRSRFFSFPPSPRSLAPSLPSSLPPSFLLAFHSVRCLYPWAHIYNNTVMHISHTRVIFPLSLHPSFYSSSSSVEMRSAPCIRGFT